MKKHLRARLYEKGWHPDDIEKTVAIVERAHERKQHWIKIFDLSLYLSALLLGLIGNFVLAVLLVPILMVAQGFWLFFLVFVFAFLFGFLFINILYHIELKLPHQHILNWLLLPIFSFLSVAMITDLTNYVDTLIGFGFQTHNYWLIAITYTAAFMLPYSLLIIREKMLFGKAKLL